MIFKILGFSIVHLILSLNTPLSIEFDSPVEFVTHGVGEKNVYIYQAKGEKILVLKALTEDIDGNMTVITKDGSYSFKLVYSDIKPHHYISIQKGKEDNNFIKSYENDSFKIMTGDNSHLVINKTKSDIFINETKIKNKEYFSLGAPLFYKNNRILN